MLLWIVKKTGVLIIANLTLNVILWGYPIRGTYRANLSKRYWNLPEESWKWWIWIIEKNECVGLQRIWVSKRTVFQLIWIIRNFKCISRCPEEIQHRLALLASYTFYNNAPYASSLKYSQTILAIVTKHEVTRTYERNIQRARNSFACPH